VSAVPAELRSKVEEKLLFWLQTRQVGPATLAVIRPRIDGTVKQ
ncbi:unnamed protein product, partial [Rotaria magnacalcarata]